MKEKFLIVANWKTFSPKDSIKLFFQSIFKELRKIRKVRNKKLKKFEIVIMPSFLNIESIHKILSKVNSKSISLGIQNFFVNYNGKKKIVCTGEITLDMIKEFNISYVLIGHSERRLIFKENNILIRKKIMLAIRYNITPILCVGDSLKDYKNKQTFLVIKKQIFESLKNFSISEIRKVIIAYEPYWSIGGNKIAPINFIQKVHSYIKKIIKNLSKNKYTRKNLIIYGGSLNEKNISLIFKKKYINGGLVGRSSLTKKFFLKSIKRSFL
jgi:triosephosphate isomerase